MGAVQLLVVLDIIIPLEMQLKSQPKHFISGRCIAPVLFHTLGCQAAYPQVSL